MQHGRRARGAEQAQQVRRGVGVVGASADDDQQRQVVDPPREVGEHLQRGAVGPLRVVDDERQRRAARRAPSTATARCGRPASSSRRAGAAPSSSSCPAAAAAPSSRRARSARGARAAGASSSARTTPKAKWRSSGPGAARRTRQPGVRRERRGVLEQRRLAQARGRLEDDHARPRRRPGSGRGASTSSSTARSMSGDGADNEATICRFDLRQPQRSDHVSGDASGVGYSIPWGGPGWRGESSGVRPRSGADAAGALGAHAAIGLLLLLAPTVLPTVAARTTHASRGAFGSGAAARRPSRVLRRRPALTPPATPESVLARCSGAADGSGRVRRLHQRRPRPALRHLGDRAAAPLGVAGRWAPRSNRCAGATNPVCTFRTRGRTATAAENCTVNRPGPFIAESPAAAADGPAQRKPARRWRPASTFGRGVPSRRVTTDRSEARFRCELMPHAASPPGRGPDGLHVFCVTATDTPAERAKPRVPRLAAARRVPRAPAGGAGRNRCGVHLQLQQSRAPESE